MRYVLLKRQIDLYSIDNDVLMQQFSFFNSLYACIFSYKLLKGDTRSALFEPDKIIPTVKTSRNNLPKQLGNWGNIGVYTYLLLPDNMNVKAFESKIHGMYEAYMKELGVRVHQNDSLSLLENLS